MQKGVDILGTHATMESSNRDINQPRINTMKTTRNNEGYTVTGYTPRGELVQYAVSKNGNGWVVDLVYGNGAELNVLYSTKADAVNAIKNQG